MLIELQVERIQESIPGMSHNREVRGFSMVQLMPSCAHSRNNPAENTASLFPNKTLVRFLPWSPGRPMTCSSDLSGPGPPGISRALEKLLHGVPIHTAQIKPPLIHPRTHLQMLRIVRS